MSYGHHHHRHVNGQLYLITPPTEDVVTLDEAKAFLRETTNDNDALITALIAAAVSTIDPASGGWLGRSLRPTTWELRLPSFGAHTHLGFYHHYYDAIAHPVGLEVALPYPPLISVDSVKYDDGDGVEQTLTVDTDYRVFGIGAARHARVEPAYNGSWPTGARYDDEAVRIRFTTGYATAAPDPLPGAIKQAVFLMVKALSDLSERNLFISAETVEGVGSRNFVVTDNGANIMRTASENLLSTFRVIE